MSEEELRQEAVRRRLGGESASEIADELGRTTRWVRKWVERHEQTNTKDWAQSRSRAPHKSPNQTAAGIEETIVAARKRLVANARSQYGALAIQWELRRLGVDPIPPARTVERVLQRAGVAKPQRHGTRYVSKGRPYPGIDHPAPGEFQQIDMVGPRHLFGAAKFNVLNAIDVGSHRAGNTIVTDLRPPALAQSLTSIWGRTGVPQIAQFDNHANFRGAIQPRWQNFSPIVATCLDLGVVARFIPIREPWRNGVIERFNNVWDKSFFRTEVFNNLDHLSTENHEFIKFHNTHHRYSAHRGQSPDQIWNALQPTLLPTKYQPPTRLPNKGRIEVIRFVRSNRRVDLFGKRILVPNDQTHQYVTALIRVRPRTITIINLDGEIIHKDDFKLSHQLA
jgi:putative transposase